ncbi:CoA-transferase [uncultured Jannaschia sp.]|uniref:CoA-transferase n=1 Tax=uncultured Jannaschia sp. TaxID=293347 RepID=UPI00263396AD|nr:CoA-transferase [uncultured Jannaschia sp.]
MSGVNKRKTLAEAVALIPDGALLALGSDRAPVALVAELVRQSRKGLRLVGCGGSLPADLLLAAKCAADAELPAPDRAGPGWTHAMAQGRARAVKVADVRQRLRAAAEKAAFAALPRDGSTRAQTVEDPFGGAPVPVLPPLAPDVALIHAEAADAAGNVLIRCDTRRAPLTDILLARATGRVIVSVEQIVSDVAVQARAEDIALLPSEVDCVVEAPFGAHPDACPGRYDADAALLEDYYVSIADAGDWIAMWISNPKDHAAYLDRLGSKRLLTLAAHCATAA